MASSFIVPAVIRGYHVYKEILDTELDEKLTCEREVRNRNDTFAVAMKRDSVTVGHVPQAISPICSIFIRRGGTIKCRVTGNRQYSSNLPQGKLQLRCILIFYMQDPREVSKTERHVNDSIQLMKEKLFIEQRKLIAMV